MNLTESQITAIEDVIWDYMVEKMNGGKQVIYLETLIMEFPELAKRAKKKVPKK